MPQTTAFNDCLESVSPYEIHGQGTCIELEQKEDHPCKRHAAGSTPQLPIMRHCTGEDPCEVQSLQLSGSLYTLQLRLRQSHRHTQHDRCLKFDCLHRVLSTCCLELLEATAAIATITTTQNERLLQFNCPDRVHSA